MAVTLNASTSSGFIQTADTSGVLTLQSNGTNALSVSSSNLQFNSGYGSVATAYGCRAWVNFNGQGTPAIRASGNVGSITDNGVGDYTINFTTALVDASYSSVGSCADGGSIASARVVAFRQNSATTTSTRLETVFQVDSGAEAADMNAVYVAIFR